MTKPLTPLLEITGLRASINDTEILTGVSLTVNAGEVHAIMGPNGSGKSTLANVIAGRPTYDVTSGDMSLEGQDLLEMATDERARAGVFLAFQYPAELAGVRNWQFLKAAVDAVRKTKGIEELKVREFDKLFNEKVNSVNIDPDLMKRSVNEGFSGGEKKRNEMFQLTMLEPKLAILDETDSGLDVDALRSVAATVNKMRDPGRGMIIVTHYQRILDFVTPDFVHILLGGRIVRSGGADLARKVEAEGYEGLISEVPSVTGSNN